MAIQLRQHGMTDFVVLERAADVGGTWRDNCYPGCACDVPSQLSSFSFELNPSWSRNFSLQQEIWDYLRHCTDSYGRRPHIRFYHEVLDAAWDHPQRHWRVRSSCGELTCDVLVTGTGASAIQFVPRIQPEVASRTLFQRTPARIMPRGERDLRGFEQKLYRAVPGLQRLVRAGIYYGRESLVPGFTINPRLLKFAELIPRAHLRRQVADPELRAKLSSMIYMIESQVADTIDALRSLQRTGTPAVEVRPEAQLAYNQTVQRRMEGTAWTAGGCSIWYLDTHGHNTTPWPTFTWRFRRATRRFQPAGYLLHEPVAQPAAA
jgi:cation diffusion facilitator CzcD-associated flavoprotein CzcO